MGCLVFPRSFPLLKKFDECRRELPTPWRGLRVHTSIICVNISIPTCAYTYVLQTEAKGEKLWLYFWNISHKSFWKRWRPNFIWDISPLSLLPTLATCPGLSLAEDKRVTVIIPPSCVAPRSSQVTPVLPDLQGSLRRPLIWAGNGTVAQRTRAWSIFNFMVFI